MAPPPLQFTTEAVIKRVRSSNVSPAGGLTGSTYKTLRKWFHEAYETSDRITWMLNRIAAGTVAPVVAEPLSAGRGVFIPKDEVGGLRPIAVGSTFMRLIGSLSLSSEGDPLCRNFLSPAPLQFGVGVQGGCELVAVAASVNLTLNSGDVDLSCKAENAFNL